MAFNGANPRDLIRVRLADLVEGVSYQLPGPITATNAVLCKSSSRFEQDNINRLAANPHVFLGRNSQRIEFKAIPADGQDIQFINFYIRCLPDGENTIFVTPSLLLNNLKKKAMNQAVRNVVEERLGIASEPGMGPGNIIRKFLGVQPNSHRVNPKKNMQRFTGIQSRKRKSRKTRKSRK